MLKPIGGACVVVFLLCVGVAAYTHVELCVKAPVC